MGSNKLIWLLSAFFILLVFSMLFCPDFISPFGGDPGSRDILFHYRMPKTLTAALSGSALAASGFMLQQFFRNNLAGPYILGISSGSSLAVGAYILAGSAIIPEMAQGIGIPVAGFAGALLILFLVLAVSVRFGNGAIILLFGVIIGQVTGALQSILSYLAMPGDLKYFTLWMMGSFSRVIGTDLLLLAASVTGGLIWAISLMRPLSVMLLGNDVAETLGVRTKRTGTHLLLCTGLLSGVTTAYCGPVAFIGMAVPNLCRLLFKTADFRFLLLVNILAGAGMALLSDIVSSAEILGMHIPVNVCTALLGGPFILYILLKKKH